MAEDHQGPLRTLYPEDEKLQGSCNVDVVAVHGLDGDCMESWTHRHKSRFRAPESTMWLKDLLPKKLPNAHVMTWQYDGRSLGSNAYGVSEAATSFLLDLRDKREGYEGKGRSIVLIGHCLGGIIIKKALCQAHSGSDGTENFADIADSTIGIMFFATPHLGSEGAQRLESMLNINAALTYRNTSKFLESLRRDSQDLFNLSEDFSPHARKYAIVSYYEGEVHPIIREVIVDRTSAELRFRHEECVMMAGNHTTICKFGQDDPRFDRVWRAIRRFRVARGR